MNFYAVILLVVASALVYLPVSAFLPKALYIAINTIIAVVLAAGGIHFIASTYHFHPAHVVLMISAIGFIVGLWFLFVTFCFEHNTENGEFRTTAQELAHTALDSLMLVVISGIIFDSTVAFMFITRIPPF